MDFFVARQPILDRSRECVAYELLFRSSADNAYSNPDPSLATRAVIANSFMLSELKSLTDGRRAYLNVTKEILLAGDVTLLPPDQVVIEVLETVEPEPAVIHALHELRQAGYTIALDDFVLTEENLPLVSHAHIIKLDFLLSKPNERREMLARLAGRHLKFLAEKVEDEAMVQEAMELALIRQKKVA